MPYISLKLPDTIVAIHLPKFSTTAQTNDSFDIRIDHNPQTRIARDGAIRISHLTITSYPQAIAAKLENGIITIPVRRS